MEHHPSDSGSVMGRAAATKRCTLVWFDTSETLATAMGPKGAQNIQMIENGKESGSFPIALETSTRAH